MMCCYLNVNFQGQRVNWAWRWCYRNIFGRQTQLPIILIVGGILLSCEANFGIVPSYEFRSPPSNLLTSHYPWLLTILHIVVPYSPWNWKHVLKLGLRENKYKCILYKCSVFCNFSFVRSGMDNKKGIWTGYEGTFSVHSVRGSHSEPRTLCTGWNMPPWHWQRNISTNTLEPHL